MQRRTNFQTLHRIQSAATLFFVVVLTVFSVPAAVPGQGVPSFLKINEILDLTQEHPTVVLAPPLRPAPQARSLGQTANGKPAALLFVDLSRPGAVDEVRAFDNLATQFSRIQPVLIAYGRTDQALEQALSIVQELGVRMPVILDSAGYFAFALAAFRPPHYAVIEGNSRLRINKIHTLSAPLASGDTLETTLLAINSGKPVPESDGEQVRDITTLKGQKLPDALFTRTDLGKAGRAKATSAELLKGGKPILLVFWMATCPHCQREIPRIWKWYGRNKGAVELLTVTNLGQKSVRDYAAAYLSKENLNDLPIYTATDDDYKKFRVQGIPSWVLTSTAGTVVEAKTGELPDIESILDRALAQAR